MDDSTSGTGNHLYFLRIALSEAAKAIPKPGAFSVGCVLVLRSSDHLKSTILSTGFSRELTGNTHAEANALDKAFALSPSELQGLLPLVDGETPTVEEIMHSVDVYTTMEPCSVRTSGLSPCADALVAAGVRACYIGVAEPDDFVNCEGAQKLKDAGIRVEWVKGLEQECLDVARRTA